MNKFFRITCVAMGMALTLSAAAYAQPSFDTIRIFPVPMN